MIICNRPQIGLTRRIRICGSCHSQFSTHVPELASSGSASHCCYVVRSPHAWSPIGKIELNHLSSEHSLCKNLPILDSRPHPSYSLSVPEDVDLIYDSIARHGFLAFPCAILAPLESLVSRVGDRTLVIVVLNDFSSGVFVVDEGSDPLVCRGRSSG